MNHSRVRIKMDGQLVSVNQAVLRSGISPCTLWDRLKRGVPKEELLKPGTGPRLKVVKPPSAPPPSARDNFIEAMNGSLTADEYLAAEESRENAKC